MAEPDGKGKGKRGFVTTFFGFTTEARSPQSGPFAPLSLRALGVSVVGLGPFAVVNLCPIRLYLRAVVVGRQ